jgi:magnesium-transporting ATPase (P-type)
MQEIVSCKHFGWSEPLVSIFILRRAFFFNDRFFFFLLLLYYIFNDSQWYSLCRQVTRAGRRQKVLIFDLVVGDIVHLSIGDQVPADGIMIECNSLTVDESQMTGESEPKKKSSEEPFLMSGCKVADGGGRMMIVAVGMNTEWGRLMSTLSSDDTEETPLQVRRFSRFCLR